MIVFAKLSSIYNDRRLTIVTGVSVVAGAAAGVLIYIAARAQGLDPTAISGDARAYILLAQNLLNHGVFSLSHSAPFVPESFRSPGYPFFLAGVLVLVGSTGVSLVIQTILMSAAPVLLYILVRPYHERAAFWGSIIFALEPVRLFYSASLLSDALFACLLLLSLILLIRGVDRSSFKLLALCGLVCGVAMLVRPIAILLPLLYGLYILWQFSARRSLAAAALCVAAFVVVLPWSVRNHQIFGSWNISSVGAANLVIYNAPEFVKFTNDQHGAAILEEFNKQQALLPKEESLSLARSGIFTSTFLSVIRGHELSYALFHIYKTIPFFLTDGLRDIVRLFNVDIGGLPNLSSALAAGDVRTIVSYFAGGGIGILLFGAGIIFWLCVTVCAAWLLYRAALGKAPRVWLLFAAVVLYFAILTGPVSNARYRLPVEGLLITAALGSFLHQESRGLRFPRVFRARGAHDA